MLFQLLRPFLTYTLGLGGLAQFPVLDASLQHAGQYNPHLRVEEARTLYDIIKGSHRTLDLNSTLTSCKGVSHSHSPPGCPSHQAVVCPLHSISCRGLCLVAAILVLVPPCAVGESSVLDFFISPGTPETQPQGLL